jgi:hypothetical protein
MEIDNSHKDFIGAETYCELQTTTFLNSRSPIITRVCRESRDVAFENAGVLGVDVEAEVKPDDPEGWVSGTSLSDPWFSPAIDIVHLNWTEAYEAEFMNASSPIPFFLWAASKGIAASITAELVHDFDPPSRFEGSRKDFDLLEHRKDYLVTLRRVCLHVDVDQAARSGLFGRLAEERVKLVDPTDKDAIQKYHELWAAGPLEDQEPATFFEKALSTESFQARIKKWSGELEQLWLRRKYFAAQEADFANIEDPEHIWLEPRRDENGESLDLQISLAGIRTEIFFPNKDHPWVKKAIEEMPRFTPMIMFRLCDRKCYKPAPPRPPPQRGGLGRRGRGFGRASRGW